MKNLMTSNVYDVSEEIVIMGTCLPTMQPKAFDQLLSICPNIYELCLEKDHINMAITKLAGMVARKNIKHIIFATVDKSPHCTQLHYIAHELKKITNKNEIEVTHYVANDNTLKQISLSAINLSKNLSELNDLIKNK